MSKIDDVVTEIHDNAKDISRMAKDRVFDVIACALIVAVGLLSLGAIELRQLTAKEIINMILEAVPFYLGAVTLAVNFYKKGVYSGKSTDVFIGTRSLYSKKVNKLTGKQLDNLNDFCMEYNKKALRMAQENLLRSVAVRYDRYNEVTYDKEGHERAPLKRLSKEELIQLFNLRVAEYVIRANNVKIKGLNPNVLLGNNDDWDITNLGPNEQELLKQRTKAYAGYFALSISLLTLMAIKNIVDWGWAGFILIAFKLIYILCRCYMKYFEGYEDITIKVTNHISRKIDILKQFDYWYFLAFPNELDTNDLDYKWLSNILIKESYINNDGSKTGDDGTSPKNVIGEQNA